MRIRKLHLAGLAAVAMGVTANGASAEDVVITTATTQPLTTSNPLPNPPPGAGSVTVNTGGSITVVANETAVTVDSDNIVSNAGTLSSNNANNSTGILVTGGRTSTITNTGTISLVEDYSLTDTDSDGDLDGSFAAASSAGRYGIWVDSGGLNGNIVTNTITIEGNNSAALRIDGLVTGDLTATGPFNITGDNSHAILIQGGAAAGVDGDVIINAPVSVRGTGSAGLTLDAPINNGELSINGAWTVTGFHSAVRPANTTNLDADDLQNGGSAVVIGFDVDNGVTIEGIGVEDDPDDDGDALATDPNDNATAQISVLGSSPAIWIAADPTANLLLGPNAAGFGFQNRGVILADGVYDTFDATGLRIEGLGGSTATTNAISNDHTIIVAAWEADAYGVSIGPGAIVSSLANRQNVLVSSRSETAQTANGIYIGTGADVGSINNSGLMRVQLFGEIGAATAILDASGSVDTITNSGSIIAELIATDENPADDILPVATGPAVAINASANLTGLIITQQAATPFPDDDAVDGDAATRPAVRIQGDILLGSAGDTVNLLSGEIIGDIAFGGGADNMTINNGAIYRGQISDSNNALSLNVINGTLDLQGGNLGITTANFGADSVLGVLLSATPAQSTLITASGAVTFAAGATILPTIPVGLPTSDTITFLTANGGLTGASNVTGVLSGSGSSYLYNLAIDTVTGDPNSLELELQVKTPAQLGMNANQGIALDPILEALRQNSEASEAFAALDNEFDFFDAYEDLMPSFASSATELAATAIQQMQSATTNRLSATRLHDLDDVSAWAQEIAYGLTREPATNQGQDFRGHGFGFAMGIDGPLQNGGLFGLSASFLTSEAEEPGRPEGEIATTFGQANAYFGTAMGGLDLDFVAGLGAGKMSSRRFVEIGDSFSAQADADWWSFEGHGAVRVSAPLRLGDWFVLTPQTALTYVFLNEQGYEEDGGGVAIDYEADSVTSQRLWGDVGIDLSAQFGRGVQSIIAPRLYVGWRANLLDEEAERTFRVVSTGDEFTLTDESLGDGGALIGVGVDATNGYSTFTLGYEGEFGDQIERHSLNASIRFRF
jgi:hypothetical protein